MYRWKIKGYQYTTGQGAWELNIGAYNRKTDSDTINYGGSITGNAPFSSVIFLNDFINKKHYVVLGTASTAWNYPAISIDVAESFTDLNTAPQTYKMSIAGALPSYTRIITSSMSTYGDSAIINGSLVALGNLNLATGVGGRINFYSNGAASLNATLLNNGNFGLSVPAPTAKCHLPAGTATAGTAPLKITSGTLLSTAEIGAFEFVTDVWYGTITTGAARKAFILDDGTRLTSGKIPVATTNGRLVDATAQTGIAILKVDYVAGELDTEAKIITALNTTNTAINTLRTALNTLNLTTTI